MSAKFVQNRGDSKFQQEITHEFLYTIEGLLRTAILIGKFKRDKVRHSGKEAGKGERVTDGSGGRSVRGTPLKSANEAKPEHPFPGQYLKIREISHRQPQFQRTAVVTDHPQTRQGTHFGPFLPQKGRIRCRSKRRQRITILPKPAISPQPRPRIEKPETIIQSPLPTDLQLPAGDQAVETIANNR